MANHPLFRLVQEHSDSISVHDRIQIALAIAQPEVLQSLLVHALPPITHAHLIGSITARVAVPTGHATPPAAGVISYEAMKCVLAPEESDRQAATATRTPGTASGRSRSDTKGPRWESPTHTLPQRFTLAQAMMLLSDLGFNTKQVEDILYMPAEAGHKSWWYSLDDTEYWTVPFLRLLRTLRYPDGTFTFQYKDYFDHEQPCCFKSQQQEVLVAIKSDLESFSETLERINLHRQALGITQVVLICHILSDLEAQGFINQGISVYPAMELVLPVQANCSLCCRRECAMNGQAHSPIVMCYGFLMDASRV